MKLQTGAFLDKARTLLAEADTMMEVDLNEASGRNAYLAGLHAAHALIFERTEKISRRHQGVQGQLQELIKDDPRFDAELRAFLPRTYNLKAIADYETGPSSDVSAEQARQAVDTAKRFIAVITEFLAEAP